MKLSIYSLLFLIVATSPILSMKRGLALEDEPSKRFRTETINTEPFQESQAMEIDNDTVDEFFKAVKEGNEKEVIRLLNAGVPIDSKDINDNTALIIALCASDEKLVELLIKRGANVNVQNVLGQTPLLLAGQNNLETIAQMLIVAGATITYEFLQIQTPEDETSFAVEVLGDSARCGLVTVVKRLLQAGVPVDEVNFEGETALYQAADSPWSCYRTQTITALLNAGANINFYPSDNSEPLNILALAVMNNNLPTLKLLLEKGAKVNGCEGIALRTAVERDNETAVRLLIQYRANLNISNINEFIYPPLIIALKRKNVAIATMLIKAGADVQGFTDSSGKTPLELALVQTLVPVIELMLEKGAALDSDADSNINTFIQAALKGDKAQLVHMITRDSSIVNKAYNLGHLTALVAACLMGHTDIVKLLLDRGITYTPYPHVHPLAIPLAMAFQKGYASIVEELLKRGVTFEVLKVTDAVKENQKELVDTYKDRLHVCSIPVQAVKHALKRKHFDLASTFLEKYTLSDQYPMAVYADLYKKGFEVKKGVMRSIDPHKERPYLLLSLAQPEVKDYIQARMLSMDDYIEQQIHDNIVSEEYKQLFVMWACMLNHKDVIKMLLTHYTEQIKELVDTQDAQGRTALMYAAMGSHWEIMSMLLDGNSNGECQKPNPYALDVNKVDKENNTALIYAVKSASLRMVNSLLRAGADITQKALYLAAARGEREMVIRFIGILAQRGQLKKEGHLSQDLCASLQGLFKD